MNEVHYFCPQCQGMEMQFERPPIIIGAGAAETIARCQLCKWEGPKSEVLAAITPEDTSYWTGDRVANALLAVAAKHAAGPMVQVLELLGLLPPIRGGEQEQASAQHVRGEVVKAVLEAVVTSAFEATAAHTPKHLERFDPKLSASVERIFHFAEPAHDDA